MSLRETLAAIKHVDHHAHPILREPPASLDEFRGQFSLSPDPRQWPHVATSATYGRAVAVLAEHLGCEPAEEAVYEHARSSVWEGYAAALLRASGAEVMLVDDAFPPPQRSTGREGLAELAGCPARHILRIERAATSGSDDPVRAVRAAVQGARGRGVVALKTVIAYRGGLDPDAVSPATRETLFAALEANERTGDPLPIQVHTGFGDPDLLMPLARPGFLKPVFERFAATDFVLLHCYPFVREAAWLTSVYANVFMDLSLTIPRVSRPATAMAEALELAPVSKLLYGSDGVRAPELFLLAAVWWRDALAEVLPKLLAADSVEPSARMILRENARRLYRL